MNLLVLVLDKYQDIELNGFLGILNNAKIYKKITFFNPNGQTNIFGSNKFGSIECVNEINIEEYDAIFIPGGAMVQELRTNQKALDTIRFFEEKEKWVFAICDAPNAINESGIFENKKYVSYPIENMHKNRLSDGSLVHVDGKYITGRGPLSTFALGLKVVEIIVGKDKSDEIYHHIYGSDSNK